MNEKYTFLPVASTLLAVDLLPKTESKSTWRPEELAGWGMGDAENPEEHKWEGDLVRC